MLSASSLVPHNQQQSSSSSPSSPPHEIIQITTDASNSSMLGTTSIRHHNSSSNVNSTNNNNNSINGNGKAEHDHDDVDDESEAKKKQLSAAARGSPLAALLYIFTAVALVLFNKNVLSGRYSLNVPALMPLIQQLVIWAGLVGLSASKTIKALPPVNVTTVSHMVPVSISFLAYLLLGMLALRGVSIPMYASLRRFTVVFVMFFDYIVDSRWHSSAVVLTVVIQVVGCILAAAHDLEYNPSGYAYIALYNAATAVYLVVIKMVKTKNDYLDNFGMMYLNSVMLIPALTVISYFTGDYDEMMNFPYRSEFGFVVSFIASAILAFVLNYAIFWNTSANSALTQTVSGQLKDIGTVLLGYIAFPPTEFSWLNFCGILLGFAGSLGYAYVKYVEPAAKK